MQLVIDTINSVLLAGAVGSCFLMVRQAVRDVQNEHLIPSEFHVRRHHHSQHHHKRHHHSQHHHKEKV